MEPIVRSSNSPSKKTKTRNNDLPIVSTSLSSTSSISSSPSSSSVGHLLTHSLSSTDLCHPDNAELVVELKRLLMGVPDGGVSSPLRRLNHPASHTAVEKVNECCIQGSCSYDLQRVTFSFLFLLCVMFLTAYVMAVVHDRVPDKTTYPPLPDLALDNLPHIPWAFELAELMILTMGIILFGIVILHRHRWVMLRRFCAITGSIFLLRCVTMLVTSLSVPGTHLKCDVSVGSSHEEKLLHAWKIISHLALSVSGVRTCGDYMFSGHTVILTVLNYFINDYTPSSWKGLHIFSWLLNCFGMFFILAGHEHYSIDVFIAFYISSRLFLYYHSLADSHAIRALDVRYHEQAFFPMFSYLEECSIGTIPNKYEWPWEAIRRVYLRTFKNPTTNTKKKG